MKFKSSILPALALSAALALGAPMAHADPASNKELVTTAMTALFIKRDATAVDRYFLKSYIQHNPMVANGSGALAGLIANIPKDFSYEPGLVIADGDYVAIHGRYKGFGPKPFIAVDIFRVENGKIAEHWDVLQEEVPASATANGNPMFEPGH